MKLAVQYKQSDCVFELLLAYAAEIQRNPSKVCVYVISDIAGTAFQNPNWQPHTSNKGFVTVTAKLI